VRDHLWDLFDQISVWTTQFLFGQVGPISGLSQSLARIFFFLILTDNLKGS